MNVNDYSLEKTGGEPGVGGDILFIMYVIVPSEFCTVYMVYIFRNRYKLPSGHQVWKEDWEGTAGDEGETQKVSPMMGKGVLGRSGLSVLSVLQWLVNCRFKTFMWFRNKEVIDAQSFNPGCILFNFQRLEDYQRRLDTSNLKLSEYPNVEELRVRNGLTLIKTIKYSVLTT